MSRSIKKGPFCAPELLKRVDEMNQTGEKKVLTTWSRASTICYSFAGPIIKRIRPRAQGRAFRINKRTSHVTIVVSDVFNINQHSKTILKGEILHPGIL